MKALKVEIPQRNKEDRSMLGRTYSVSAGEGRAPVASKWYGAERLRSQ